MARAYFAIPDEAARGVSALPQQHIRVLRVGISGSLRGQVAQELEQGEPISSLIPLKWILQGAPTGCAVSTMAREQQARRQQKQRPSACGRDAFGSSLADVGCANGLQPNTSARRIRSQERRNVLQGRQRPAQLSLELDAVQVLPRASIRRAASGGCRVFRRCRGGGSLSREVDGLWTPSEWARHRGGWRRCAGAVCQSRSLGCDRFAPIDLKESRLCCGG
eukprot:s60_g42.t1